MARVLILCPTFDHQDTLFASMESVRRQTCQDFEVRVIGDGAPERTAEIMRDIAARDPRFSYERHEKHARTGEPHRDPIIRGADCDVVAYIADDDLWLPWHLEWMVEALETHDFAHSMHTMLHTDGHIQAIPFQFASPALRKKIVGRRTWCFGLSFAAHTRDAYLRLDEGWATTRPGVPTDMNMWAKFAERDDMRIFEMLYPTALHLHSQLRRSLSPRERAAEASRVLDSIGDPAFLSSVFDRMSFLEHFRYLFEDDTPRALRSIAEVLEHHGVRTRILRTGEAAPPRPDPGVLYLRPRALEALDIQWRFVAGHADAEETCARLDEHLRAWPEDHDARRLLAEICLDEGDADGAKRALGPFRPGVTALKYTASIPRALLAKGESEEALAAASILLEQDPTDPYLHLHRAQALLALGHTDEALWSARAALERKPDLGWAELVVAQGLRARGDVDGARAMLARADEHGVPPALVAHEETRIQKAERKRKNEKASGKTRGEGRSP